VLRNLTKEEYESEKRRIVELMFNPYSSQNGDEYIGGQQVSKDKLKNRVDYQMYKNFVPNGSDIQSDIYQEVFLSLLTINEKNTKKFVDGYYQNPNSVYHFAYTLTKYKFSVDKNYPTKPNSIGKKLMYGSSFDQFNSEISYQTDEDTTSDNIYVEDG
jgi:hypothetical protein